MSLWRVPEPDAGGSEPGWELHFSPGADEALRVFERWLEPQLAEGEPLSYLAGWASKLAGAIARLSLILHMAGTLGVGNPWNEPISRETVEAAIALGRDYFLPHAQAAFGMMGADERERDAARAVSWLASDAKCENVKAWKGVPLVSKRDIQAGVFGGSRSADEVSAVCRLLCEHGYLRSVSPSWQRRDSQWYEINPHEKDDCEG